MELPKPKYRKRTLADKLQKLLSSGVGERAGLAPFVKSYPQVLKRAVMPYEGAIVRGISEFRFGSELRADFVLLTGFSGGFIVNMIELEPSTVNLLNKNGSMAARFNHAYSQIQRWEEYASHRSKGAAFGLELERQFREREILVPSLRGRNPIDNTARFPLSSVDSHLWLQYTIVIGRRESLTPAEIARKGVLMREQQIEVMSWDRLMDAARGFLPSGKPIPYVPPTVEDTKELDAFIKLFRK